MNLIHRRLPYLGFILGASLLFVLTLWDIISAEGWMQQLLAGYGVLFVLALVFVFLRTQQKQPALPTSISTFEKTLQGQLFHFKCPNCHGIFAIKKSRRNNNKPFTLTCPDCGCVGQVTSSSPVIEETVPHQKSVNKTFKCEQCHEWVTVWAEGTDIVNNVQIYSCPYCGTRQTLKPA